MELFRKLPRVVYNGHKSTNLLSRVVAIKANFNKFAVYFPYEIKDGERPDTISYDYYGTSEYAWMIMLTNDVYDIYSHWPLSYREFYDYLSKKYGNPYEIKNVPHHYVYAGQAGETADEIARKSWEMSPQTYSLMTTDERAGWTSVDTYTWEEDQNNAKRQIRLLSNELLRRVDNELEEMFQIGR